MQRLIVISLLALAACSKPVDEPASNFKPSSAQPGAHDAGVDAPLGAPVESAATAPPAKPGAGKLEIKDTVVGKGREAKKGDKVKVHYTGTLLDGTKFDSSFDTPTKKPFDVTLGAHGVIEGWEQGILGMKKGGKRTLTIPPELAYGANGYPPTIPPNATLKFDIELVDLE